MKLKAHPQYKPSGVWFGDIPDGWKIMPLKRIVSIPITDGPHETPEILDEGIPFISAEAVRNNKIDFERKRGYISEDDHKRFSLKYHPERNDIYMIKSGATTGNLAIVETDKEFNIWSPLAVIRTHRNKAFSRFVLAAMNSKEFQTSVQLFWSYGTQQNIGMNVIENLQIPIPPLSEQQSIAGYLDHETGKIDELISKKEQLIERLKEKRTALISRAVTKGIVQSFMFDTNAFDRLLQADLDSLNAHIYATHIQRDQIAAIPNEKKEKKQRLFRLIKTIDAKSVSTSVAVWDVSKWNECCFGDGETNDLYQRIAKRNGPEDALIAVTAIARSFILVSEDKKLLEDVRNHDGKAVDFNEFKKQAFIKMKPSGVEWLGDVPEHWQVKKLRYLCSIETGDKDTVDAEDDGIYPFFVRSQTIERINSYTKNCEGVLTAGDGVGVGKVFHYVHGKFDFHQRVYLFSRFREITGKYFFLYFRELFSRVAFDGGSKSTVDSLRRPMLSNFIFAIPPISEQQFISEYIDRETKKIDNLIIKVTEAIEKLKEYRTALISAAVTGKIDVRSGINA